MSLILKGKIFFLIDRLDFDTMLPLPVVRGQFSVTGSDDGLLLPSKGGIFTFLCYYSSCRHSVFDYYSSDIRKVPFKGSGRRFITLQEKIKLIREKINPLFDFD